MKQNWEQIENELKEEFKQKVKDAGFDDRWGTLSNWIANIHYYRKKYNEDTLWKNYCDKQYSGNSIDKRKFLLELIPCRDAIGFIPPLSIAPVFYKGTYNDMYKKLLNLIERPNDDTEYLQFYSEFGSPIMF